MPATTTHQAPHLVVEVMSPGESWSKILRRISHFLDGGVEIVWLVDPEDRCITIYRPNSHPEVLDGNDELIGDGALPDFRYRVADFFFMPEQANGGDALTASS